MENGVLESAIIVEPEEIAAVEKALTIANPGDLVLIFADNIKRSWKQIIYHGDSHVGVAPVEDPILEVAKEPTELSSNLGQDDRGVYVLIDEESD